MAAKKPLFMVAAPSTTFIEEAYWDDKGVWKGIRFSYQQLGVTQQAGIEFQGISATRTRSERCCTVEHIEGAYDTLVEISPSSWVEEIKAETNPQWRDQGKCITT